MRISWVPLKSVATVRVSNVDKKTVEGDEPVRLCNYTDVYYNNTISADMTFVSATATQEQIRIFGLCKDDVIITKDSEAAEDIGIAVHVESSDRDLVCGYHLAILRPNRARIHGRFLFWSLMSRNLRDQFSISATGVTRFGLRTESIASSRIPFYSLEKQIAIADFLDTETARIDALVAKKRRMIVLALERVNQSMQEILEKYRFNFPGELTPDWKTVPLPCSWRIVRLSQVLVQLTNGYVGPTRDILADSGVRYIQSLHIKDGEIDFDRRPFYVSHDWHSVRPRIHLRGGDVLIVQTGDIGKVAVVPEEFGPASCHALQIARVRRDMLSGAFLAEYLRTPFGYELLLSRATGALHPHLEGGIRDVPIILPPKEIQSATLRGISDERSHQKKLESRLVRQIALLRERRQALITAAVTGEMDVPGVSA